MAEAVAPPASVGTSRRSGSLLFREPVSRQAAVLVFLTAGLLLVDLVNGALAGGPGSVGIGLSPGQAIRGVLVALIAVLVLLVRGRAIRLLSLGFLALGCWGVIGPAATFLEGGSAHDLIGDLMQLSKALYCPGLVLVYVLLFRRRAVTIRLVFTAVEVAGALAGASIIVGSLTGIGQATYQWSHVGFKGLFISQNDIGLGLGLTLFASVGLLLSTRRIVHVVAVAVTIVGMVLLGSRAAAMAVIVAPLATCFAFIWGAWRSHGGRRNTSGALVVLLVLAAAGGGLWAYHRFRSEHFQSQKLQLLAQSEVIFVRGALLEAGLNYTSRRPWPKDIIGDGIMGYGRQVAARLGLSTDAKLAEVDWLDMYGAYGLPFVLLVYAYYLYFFRRARRLSPLVTTGERLTAELMLAWFCAHSVIAGHAVADPIPGGLIAPVLAYLWFASEGTGRGASAKRTVWNAVAPSAEA